MLFFRGILDNRVFGRTLLIFRNAEMIIIITLFFAVSLGFVDVYAIGPLILRFATSAAAFLLSSETIHSL